MYKKGNGGNKTDNTFQLVKRSSNLKAETMFKARTEIESRNEKEKYIDKK